MCGNGIWKLNIKRGRNIGIKKKWVKSFPERCAEGILVFYTSAVRD